METLKTSMELCIEKHAATNHFYDTYLPYEFHLRMVVGVYQDFMGLLPEWVNGAGLVYRACCGHDLIEDTRTSYNDVCKMLGEPSAKIIYAVTNEKGRNRSERGGENYYKGIRETPYADFVKLCDRIANVQYSKMTKSRMFEMYRSENDKFISLVGNNYPEMNEYLINLFN